MSRMLFAIMALACCAIPSAGSEVRVEASSSRGRAPLLDLRELRVAPSGSGPGYNPGRTSKKAYKRRKRTSGRGGGR